MANKSTMADGGNGKVDFDRCDNSPPAALDNSNSNSNINSNEREDEPSSTCAAAPSHRPRYPHWHVWRAADALEPPASDDEDVNPTTDGDGAGSREGPEAPPRRSWLCREERTDEAYSPLVRESAAVLRNWGRRFEGRSDMRSFVNKKSLLHEVEESVVATRILLDWLELDGPLRPSSGAAGTGTCPPPVTVVDLCAGKGIFSVLLSYLAGRSAFGAPSGPLSRVKRCIMVERETDIDWTHVGEANRDAMIDPSTSSAGVGAGGAAIPIDIWDGCDVHEDDALASRLRASVADSGHQIVLVGIHLCRTLSPRCVGIYNKLGPDLCPLLCLAPCCLPRLDSFFGGRGEIPVARYETEAERRRRGGEADRARRARGKCCAVCGSAEHGTQGCPTLPTEEEDGEGRLRILREAAPCWRCGESGHRKSNCPTLLDLRRGVGGAGGGCRPAQPTAPTFRSIDLQAVRECSSPFDGYCSALADAVQLRTDTRGEADGRVGGDWNVRGGDVVGGGGRVELRVTPLAGRVNSHDSGVSSNVSPKSHGDSDINRNWNANRKCTWIVAAR